MYLLHGIDLVIYDVNHVCPAPHWWRHSLGGGGGAVFILVYTRSLCVPRVFYLLGLFNFKYNFFPVNIEHFV